MFMTVQAFLGSVTSTTLIRNRSCTHASAQGIFSTSQHLDRLNQ